MFDHRTGAGMLARYEARSARGVACRWLEQAGCCGLFPRWCGAESKFPIGGTGLGDFGNLNSHRSRRIAVGPLSLGYGFDLGLGQLLALSLEPGVVCFLPAGDILVRVED